MTNSDAPSAPEGKKQKLKALAKRIERMQTPDKLRLAAEILEKTNDVDMALAIISQAVEHLMFVKAVSSRSPL